MDSWQVQDAKARFSEFLNATLTSGPQIVTRHERHPAGLAKVLQPVMRMDFLAARALQMRQRAGHKHASLAQTFGTIRQRRETRIPRLPSRSNASRTWTGRGTLRNPPGARLTQ